MEDTLTHTHTHSTQVHAHTKLDCKMEGIFWCLTKPQMPGSVEMVLSTDKTYTIQNKQTNTHHIQNLAEAMDANWSPLFQSTDPDIIHSPSVFVCLSLSLRCSEVCKIIHSSSLQSPGSLSGTHIHIHTLGGNIFCLLFITKLRDLVAKRPNAPLVPLISISHSFHAIFFVGFASEETITAHRLFTMTALSYQQG